LVSIEHHLLCLAKLRGAVMGSRMVGLRQKMNQDCCGMGMNARGLGRTRVKKAILVGACSWQSKIWTGKKVFEGWLCNDVFRVAR